MSWLQTVQYVTSQVGWTYDPEMDKAGIKKNGWTEESWLGFLKCTIRFAFCDVRPSYVCVMLISILVVSSSKRCIRNSPWTHSR